MCLSVIFIQGVKFLIRYLEHGDYAILNNLFFISLAFMDQYLIITVLQPGLQLMMDLKLPRLIVQGLPFDSHQSRHQSLQYLVLQLPKAGSLFLVSDVHRG